MSRPLRIAMFVGSFPVISETFIIRQITGLIDLGHRVDIFADTRPEADQPVQPDVEHYGLRERTTWMDIPPETAPYEMPVRPLFGRTWPPGAAESISNLRRVARALPPFLRGLMASPRLAWAVLRSSEYGYRAASLSGVYRLARLAQRRGAYDVLHAHFGPTANSFRFARELYGAPLVVSFHGYDFCTVPRKEGAGVYAKLFAAADRFTANSHYTQRQLEQLGCPPVRLRRLPVGLDPGAFPFRERSRASGEPLRIASVGRLVEIKGHEFLIRAVARLLGRRAAATRGRGDTSTEESHDATRDLRYWPLGSIVCEIVGDGPLRQRLQALIRELGLEKVVTLRGALAGPQVREVLDRAHVFVLPSVSVAGDCEGQGLALQEAQACGLPVIATRHGALPEGLKEGESGFLVPERDAAALAERLAFLAEHPEAWPAMGRAGRAWIEAEYDIARLNGRLAELYEEVIQEHDPA